MTIGGGLVSTGFGAGGGTRLVMVVPTIISDGTATDLTGGGGAGVGAGGAGGGGNGGNWGRLTGWGGKLTMQPEVGVTTVYVTHDQTEAMTIGNRAFSRSL